MKNTKTTCKGVLTSFDYGRTEFCLYIHLGRMNRIEIKSTTFSSETVARNQANKFAQKHNLEIDWE